MDETAIITGSGFFSARFKDEYFMPPSDRTKRRTGESIPSGKRADGEVMIMIHNCDFEISPISSSDPGIAEVY